MTLWLARKINERVVRMRLAPMHALHLILQTRSRLCCTHLDIDLSDRGERSSQDIWEAQNSSSYWLTLQPAQFSGFPGLILPCLMLHSFLIHHPYQQSSGVVFSQVFLIGRRY